METVAELVCFAEAEWRGRSGRRVTPGEREDVEE